MPTWMTRELMADELYCESPLAAASGGSNSRAFNVAGNVGGVRDLTYRSRSGMSGWMAPLVLPSTRGGCEISGSRSTCSGHTTVTGRCVNNDAAFAM